MPGSTLIASGFDPRFDHLQSHITKLRGSDPFPRSFGESCPSPVGTDAALSVTWGMVLVTGRSLRKPGAVAVVTRPLRGCSGGAPETLGLEVHVLGWECLLTDSPSPFHGTVPSLIYSDY